MIKHLKCYCCCTKLCYPTRKYVRITNNGDLCIRFILQYGIYCETFTQEIELSKGHAKKVNIPNNAVNICLNILNISLPSPKLIYHECISGLENTCYEIFNTAQNPLCKKTIC